MNFRMPIALNKKRRNARFRSLCLCIVCNSEYKMTFVLKLLIYSAAEKVKI